MDLTVVEASRIAADTLRIGLASLDGGALPAFEPGAHVELAFAGFERRYSLTSSPLDTSRYEICVLRAAPGRGGSAYLHDALRVGDRLRAAGPFNAFRLRLDARHSAFFAGGIGITPFLTMTEALAREGRSFELHYAARRADRLLPLPDYAGRIRRYIGTGAERSLDVGVVLSRLSTDVDLYVCGPRQLIAFVRAEAAARGWSKERVHFESFGASVDATDAPVEVRLALSGSTLRVAPGTSLLDALLAHGVWAPYECRRGECGSCVAEVLAGEPDHRDLCLTDEQRRHSICTCVSWARSPTLELKL